jgi:transcription initiation factor IIE alpha subunit
MSGPENLEQEENHFQDSTTVIEAKVMDDRELSDGGFRLLAIINNFLNKNGYATCSNGWLSERMGVCERTVRRYLEELEDRGHVWRHMISDTDRRIWTPSAYSYFLRSNDLVDKEFRNFYEELKMKQQKNKKKSPSRKKETKSNSTGREYA